MIVQAGRHLAHEFAEPQHHPELVRLDAEEAGKSPDQDRGEDDQPDPLAAEIAARHDAAQLVLAAAQQLFQIGRRRGRRLWTRAPWAFSARTPGSTALIAPRHCNLLAPAQSAGHYPYRCGYRGAVGQLQRACECRSAAAITFDCL